MGVPHSIFGARSRPAQANAATHSANRRATGTKMGARTARITSPCSAAKQCLHGRQTPAPARNCANSAGRRFAAEQHRHAAAVRGAFHVERGIADKPDVRSRRDPARLQAPARPARDRACRRGRRRRRRGAEKRRPAEMLASRRSSAPVLLLTTREIDGRPRQGARSIASRPGSARQPLEMDRAEAVEIDLPRLLPALAEHGRERLAQLQPHPLAWSRRASRAGLPIAAMQIVRAPRGSSPSCRPACCPNRRGSRAAARRAAAAARSCAAAAWAQVGRAQLAAERAGLAVADRRRRRSARPAAHRPWCW